MRIIRIDVTAKLIKSVFCGREPIKVQMITDLPNDMSLVHVYVNPRTNIVELYFQTRSKQGTEVVEGAMMETSVEPTVIEFKKLEDEKNGIGNN